jgi:uncharacterized membrane protein
MKFWLFLFGGAIFWFFLAGIFGALIYVGLVFLLGFFVAAAQQANEQNSAQGLGAEVDSGAGQEHSFKKNVEVFNV